jgi:hypothetical protein
LPLFEFSLSKGSIRNLARKESLFDKSKQLEFATSYENISIRPENPTPILRVIDFQQFEIHKEKMTGLVEIIRIVNEIGTLEKIEKSRTPRILVQS